MTRLACLTLSLLAAVALPAYADSSASSASDSVSDSVGSLSDSLKNSSNSSSGDHRMAAGDYRVIDVAQAAGRPGMMQARLQAITGKDEFTLVLPRAAAERGALVPGQIVTAEQRPYGMEFAAAAHGQPQAAFFLVLNDDWQRELPAKPVVL